MDKIALIIGNGMSRKDLDLKALKRENPDLIFFGCNALYREDMDNTIPDFLVAIDDGMIEEIAGSRFPQIRVLIPPVNERWEPADCNPRRPRSNAGMAAMLEAIKKGFTTLICIGFDFLYTDREQSTSNLFDGTPNYGPETRASAADNPGRVNFLNYTALKNPHVNFLFAYPEDQQLQRVFANNIKSAVYADIFHNTLVENHT